MPGPNDVDARTPVLVGVAGRTQRSDGPTDSLDAAGLMIEVAQRAVVDAASPDAAGGSLGRAVGWIGVPEGTWTDPDPGRHVAHALGAPDAHTVVADVGITQQDLISEACRVLRDGEAEVAVVVGGEARHRERAISRSGVEVAERPPASDGPGWHWRPDTLGLADVEIERNIVAPVISYALVDRALAASRGWTGAEHRRWLGELWAAFAGVAAGREDAWDRNAPDAEAIVHPGPDNRMLAVPYTKRLASQWNVDQAAALVLCTAQAAHRFGVPEDRWVFGWSAAVSNHAVPLVARAELHRSPGAAVAARRVLDGAGIDLAAVDHRDLYSCFPAAVQVLAAELGCDGAALATEPPTVTGGMTFGGGPLNNYVLGALVALAQRLRADPGSIGLSSSVSGMLTKVGFSLWSTRPPPGGGFAGVDVTAEVAAVDHPRPVDPAATGTAVVVSATVDHAGPAPRAVAVCELDGGRRTIAETTRPEVCEVAAELSVIGRTVTVDPAGVLSL